jgi:hypothetical protein
VSVLHGRDNDIHDAIEQLYLLAIWRAAERKARESAARIPVRETVRRQLATDWVREKLADIVYASHRSSSSNIT